MKDENDDLSHTERDSLRILFNSAGEFLPLEVLPGTSSKIARSLLKRRLIEAGPPAARYSKYRIGYRLTTVGRQKAARIRGWINR